MTLAIAAVTGPTYSEPTEECILLSSLQTQPEHEGSTSLSQEQHGHSTASCPLPSRSRGKARGGSGVVTRMLRFIAVKFGERNKHPRHLTQAFSCLTMEGAGPAEQQEQSE